MGRIRRRNVERSTQAWTVHLFTSVQPSFEQVQLVSVVTRWFIHTVSGHKLLTGGAGKIQICGWNWRRWPGMLTFTDRWHATPIVREVDRQHHLPHLAFCNSGQTYCEFTSSHLWHPNSLVTLIGKSTWHIISGITQEIKDRSFCMYKTPNIQHFLTLPSILVRQHELAIFDFLFALDK
jgi:hypothetical protein